MHRSGSRTSRTASSERAASSGRAAPRADPEERRARILDVLRAVEPGDVVTYGEVAEEAGYPRHHRLVGAILATMPADVPWWRIVSSTGRLVPGNEARQARLLRAEQVEVTDGRVTRAPAGRFAR